MTPDQAMQRIDTLLSHVWMVRTFLKHSEEAEEDEPLQQVHRGLYDFVLSLGSAWQRQDAPAYLRQARKKLRRLSQAADLLVEIQPEISGHTNFQMATRSLVAAVNEVAKTLQDVE